MSHIDEHRELSEIDILHIDEHEANVLDLMYTNFSVTELHISDKQMVFLPHTGKVILVNECGLDHNNQTISSNISELVISHDTNFKVSESDASHNISESVMNVAQQVKNVSNPEACLIFEDPRLEEAELIINLSSRRLHGHIPAIESDVNNTAVKNSPIASTCISEPDINSVKVDSNTENQTVVSTNTENHAIGSFRDVIAYDQQLKLPESVVMDTEGNGNEHESAVLIENVSSSVTSHALRSLEEKSLPTASMFNNLVCSIPKQQKIGLHNKVWVSVVNDSHIPCSGSHYHLADIKDDAVTVSVASLSHRQLQDMDVGETLVIERPKVHECYICRVQFKSITELFRHRVRHNEDMSSIFKCEQCDQRFKEPVDLEKHKVLHLNPELFCCCICGDTFTDLHNYKCHIRIHNSNGPYVCNICSQVFDKKNEFLFHSDHHDFASGIQNRRRLQCDVCRKIFPEYYKLKRHMNCHYGEKSHKCLICGKKFIERSKLNRHMLSHSGKKDFPCPECNKSFTLKHNMLKHLNIHKNIRPYVCDICNRAFSQKIVLQRHQKVHEQNENGE